jgi:hypothetical protein
MKILLGEFRAKVGKEDIFKPIIENENLHEVSNGNGGRDVKFSTKTNTVALSPQTNYTD